MDELAGDQGTWHWDGESVRIRYRQGRRTDRLLRRLGQCQVPLAALATVEFHPRVTRRRWSLRMVLREGADPYAAVGAYLTPRAWPFRLTWLRLAALPGQACQLGSVAYRAGERHPQSGGLPMRDGEDHTEPVQPHRPGAGRWIGARQRAHQPAEPPAD
jgi:hypothetical protein